MNARKTTRYRQAKREGYGMLAAALFGFAALIGGAAYVDHARGISVAQSLQSAGL